MHPALLTKPTLVFGAITTLLLGACDRDHNPSIASTTGASRLRSADTLVATVLFAGDELSRPQSLGVVGDWVLVGDVPRPHALHVIGSEGGAYLASWGREGKGPGEFSRLWGIQGVENGTDAWLYDPGQTRLTRIDVRALAAGEGEPLRGSVNLTGDLMPMTAIWLGDSAIVSSGLFAGGRLARFEPSGRLRSVAGPLPPAPDNVPAAVAQHAYSGTLVKHPGDQALAIATRHADRLEIQTAAGEPLHVGRGPDTFDPVYEVQVRGNQPSMATGDDLRFGYVDAAAAGEHVYALYSGFTRGQLPGRANFGAEVHVFDWEGTLRRILPLDRRALAVAVSPDERTLYTIVHDPAPAVLRYDLP